MVPSKISWRKPTKTAGCLSLTDSYAIYATRRGEFMKMELHEVKLYGIGAATSSGKGMAAKLQLSFLDADAKLINHVNLDILVPRDLKGTLADMQKAARANGIEVLRPRFLHWRSTISQRSKR
jgi:hypothetical protein